MHWIRTALWFPVLIDYLKNPTSENGKSGMKTYSTPKGFRTISKNHVNEALTTYLRTMSLIEKNEEVTNFNKAPDSLDIRIERVKHD